MKWIVDADIEGAFDHIDHAFLLEAIGPVPGRELIRQWLKAGYLEQNVWYPTEAGTPQGGVISPLLANIALHGMEEALGVTRKRGTVSSNCAVVRYADDFVVTCTTQAEAERAVDRLVPWLAKRGLHLSREKTRVVHITDGFDFLGFTIRQYPAPGTRKRGVVLLIKPSRTSVARLRKRLKDEWRALRGHNVGEVVKRLTPIIRGWANYFRIGVSRRTFEALDYWMFQRELRYVRSIHTGKSWSWRRQRYWGRLHDQRKDNWVFGDPYTGIILLKFSWFSIDRHVLVSGAASPDDPALVEYWAKRSRMRTRTLSPSMQKLARQQGYVCQTCGEPLMNGEELQVHHRLPKSQGGTDGYHNLELDHLYCHQQLHARATTSAVRGRT